MATVNLVSVIFVVLNSRVLSSQISPKLIVTVTTGYADIEGGTLTVTTGSGSGRYENGSFTTSMSGIGDKGPGHILDGENGLVGKTTDGAYINLFPSSRTWHCG